MNASGWDIIHTSELSVDNHPLLSSERSVSESESLQLSTSTYLARFLVGMGLIIRPFEQTLTVRVVELPGSKLELLSLEELGESSSTRRAA